MEKEGKYIYCIIGTKQERNFGPIGISKRGGEVLTISYDDLSMVVSNTLMGKLEVSRQNLLVHEKVIEEVMKEFDEVTRAYKTLWEYCRGENCSFDEQNFKKNAILVKVRE